MTFSINEIISRLNVNYPAKQSFYEVFINGGISSFVDNPSIDIMFNCSNVIIPGTNLNTYSDNRHGIGTINTYPDAKFFTECYLTFYETEYAQEKRFFNIWIDKIYDKETKRFNFFKEYVKNITIREFDRMGRLSCETILTDCYPKNISTIERGYGLNGIPQFNVDFAFFEMTTNYFINPKDTNNVIF